MGAVAEMRRRWERDDARRRSLAREALWGVPVAAVFLVGALFTPRTGSAWLDALLLTVYGALVIALLVLVSRRRGAPPLGFAMRLTFLNTVIFSVQRLFAEGSREPVQVLLQAGVVASVVLLADYTASRWTRRRTAAPGAP